MNRPWRFGCHMAGNASREGKLLEQSAQAVFRLRDMRINLAISALQKSIGHQAGPAVTGARDIDHVKIQPIDEPIEMEIDEVQSRRRAPMAEQAGLDVFEFQRLAQQGILQQVYLPNG